VLALGVAHRLEDRLDGERAVGGDQVGDLVRLGQRLAVGHDVADQPDLLGLRRQDVPAGEQQVGGDRCRGSAGERTAEPPIG
jgi:hypothetical protein